MNRSKEYLAKEMAKSGDLKEKFAKYRFITVGRMVYQKNYSLALDAANILKKDGYDFEWYFVGDGDDRLNVESKIKKYGLENNIILVGQQNNPYPYIASCDVYIQTFRFEGYCLTLAEARMFNKPSVSTNFEVVYNQLVDGENGLIVEMTPEAVVNGIERMINDDELRNSIVEYLKTEKRVMQKK